MEIDIKDKTKNNKAKQRNKNKKGSIYRKENSASCAV